MGRCHQVDLGRTDEARDKEVAGLRVKLLRRAHLLDLAAAQHDDPAGHGHGFDLIVGHVDHRGTQPVVERGKLGAHLHAQLCVEVRQRLVEEEELRLTHDGTADGHTLLLPAGQLARLALHQRLDLQDARRLRHAPGHFRFRHLEILQAESEVLGDGHMRVERVALEDHRQLALGRGQIVDDGAADGNRALGNILKPGNHAQQGGLAAARRADEHQKFPVHHVEIQPLDDAELAVALADVAKCQSSHSYVPLEPCSHFIPEVAMPRTISFWKATKKIRTGTSESTDMANICP